MLNESWKNHGEVLYLDCWGMRRHMEPRKKLKVPFSLHWVAHEGSVASLSRQIYPHFYRKLQGFQTHLNHLFSRHLIYFNSFTCFLTFLYRILLFLGTQPLSLPEMLSRHVTPLAAADNLRSPLVGSERFPIAIRTEHAAREQVLNVWSSAGSTQSFL